MRSDSAAPAATPVEAEPPAVTAPEQPLQIEPPEAPEELPEPPEPAVPAFLFDLPKMDTHPYASYWSEEVVEALDTRWLLSWNFLFRK